MINTFLYYVLLLLIIFLLFWTSSNNRKNSPNKIKIMMYLLFTFCFLRYGTLFIFILLDKQSVVQYLRFFNYTSFVYVPMILLTCFYIFWRNNKVNFNLEYVFLGVLTVGGIVCMYLFKPYLKVTTNYGYLATLENDIMYNFICTSIFMLILISIIYKMEDKFVNKNGMVFLLICTSILIVQNVLLILNIQYIPNGVIGDIILLFMCNYSINTFKK